MFKYKDKNVLVVGLGKSGVSVAKYLAAHGASVTAIDAKPSSELSAQAIELNGLGVKVEAGTNDVKFFENADVVVVSPGVSLSLPGLKAATSRKIPIVGDVEIAGREIKKPIVAVTGTNGKTTTTALIGHLLNESGVKCAVGGNIGTPVLDILDDINASEFAVLEVSSFQIDTSPSLTPKISIFLNVTQDHLDRHSTFENYIASKAALFERMGRDGFGIYNAADEAVSQSVVTSKCTLVPFDATGKIFSRTNWKGLKCWYEEGDLMVSTRPNSVNRYKLENVSLKGVHNRENMLSALAAAELCGADSISLQKALESFKGLSHRIEFVAEWHGVNFYNDSKGTNVGATIRALEQFAEPVILIAGGLAKGAKFDSMKQSVKDNVKLAILIGEAAKGMARDIEGATEIAFASSMEEAVRRATLNSEPGDVVLLSPACASFDMFRDYADRGNKFVEAVRKVTKEIERVEK